MSYTPPTSKEVREYRQQHQLDIFTARRSLTSLALSTEIAALPDKKLAALLQGLLDYMNLPG